MILFLGGGGGVNYYSKIMQSKCIICILLLLDETGLVNEKPELLKEVWVFIHTHTLKEFLFFFN